MHLGADAVERLAGARRDLDYALRELAGNPNDARLSCLTLIRDARQAEIAELEAQADEGGKITTVLTFAGESYVMRTLEEQESETADKK